MSLAPEVCRLFTLINPILVPGQGLTVQFIGAHPNEGVSTIARDFALTAAQYINEPVLLLDLDTHQDSHFNHFRQVLKQLGSPANIESTLDLDIDLSPLIGGFNPVHSSPVLFHALPEIRLILGRLDTKLDTSPGQVPCILNRPQVWDELRSRFMLTVVDSSPSNQSFDSIVISGAMDAVVLVVRAESTRIPVVENLRDRLVAQGAPLVGLVLNQRRFYIPKSVYRLLHRL
jgi:Mrp family chromosome partitioning ATPase